MTQKTNYSAATTRVSVAELSQLYHLPLRDAARALNLSMTMMKRVCRHHNIKAWPFRQMDALKRSLERVEELLKSKDQKETEALLEKKRNLVTKMEDVIGRVSRGMKIGRLGKQHVVKLEDGKVTGGPDGHAVESSVAADLRSFEREAMAERTGVYMKRKSVVREDLPAIKRFRHEDEVIMQLHQQCQEQIQHLQQMQQSTLESELTTIPSSFGMDSFFLEFPSMIPSSGLQPLPHSQLLNFPYNPMEHCYLTAQSEVSDEDSPSTTSSETSSFYDETKPKLIPTSELSSLL